MKNMNLKRRTVVLTAIGLSTILLAAVAFAGAAPNAGYEAFKDMMQSESKSEFKPEAGTVSLKMIDNGTTILEAKGNFNGNEETNQMLGNIQLTADQLQKDLEVYVDKGQLFLVDKEKQQVYVGQPHDEMDSWHSEANMEKQMHMQNRGDWDQAGEAFFDHMVGDMAKRFSLVADSDGSTDIVFEAKAEELPTWMTLMIAAKNDPSEMGNERHREMTMSDAQLAQYPLFKELEGLKDVLPILVDEKQLDKVTLKFDRDLQGQPLGFDVNVALQGKDAQGNVHQLQIIAEVEALETQGSPSIQPIDITGMEVFELPEHQRNER